MQSNVTVPASGSKFKLWLLIVVLAVAIFGGAAYGYYSWYKTNEPPPSLEIDNGSGLQGLMKIQGGTPGVEGFAKFEEKDLAECKGNVFNMEGGGTDYLYSPEEATFRDFYDSLAVKQNKERTFILMFYSPGEEVGGKKYENSFYLFPTEGTNYKAKDGADYKINHVKLSDLADYKIPAYRSVILLHDDTMGTCTTTGKAVQAYYDSIGKSMDETGLFINFMEANLKPLPKGWVLVPFGWNYKNIEVLSDKLKDNVDSIWVKVGGEPAKKVKEGNKDLISAEVEGKKTRSVWMNMKDVTDVMKIMKEKKDGGGDVAKDTKLPEVVSALFYAPTKDWKLEISMNEPVNTPEMDDFVTLCLLKEGTEKTCEGDAIKFTSLGINVMSGGFAIEGYLAGPPNWGKTYLVVVSDKVTDKAGNPLNPEKNFTIVKTPGGGDIADGGACKLTSECSAGLVCAEGGVDKVSGRCTASPCDLCKGELCNTLPAEFISVTCGAVEICNDKVDNDKNGKVDCEDVACVTDIVCISDDSEGEVAKCKTDENCMPGFKCEGTVPGVSGFVCIKSEEGVPETAVLAKSGFVCKVDADCETGLKCQNKGLTIGLVCGAPVKVGGSCFNKAVCEDGLVCVDKNNGEGFSCQEDACDVCGEGMTCAKGDGDPVQVGCVAPVVEEKVGPDEASVSVKSAEEVCTDSRLGGNSEVVVHFDKEVSYNSASKVSFDGWVFKVKAENVKTALTVSSVEYYSIHDKSSLLIGLDGAMLEAGNYLLDVSKSGLAITYGIGMPIAACTTQSTDFGIINVKQTSSSQVVVSFDSAVDAEMLNETIDKIDLIEVDDIDVTRVGPGGGDPVQNDVISVKVVSGTDGRDVIITFADEIPDGMYQFQFTDSDAMKSVSGAAMRDVGSFFNFKGGFPPF